MAERSIWVGTWGVSAGGLPGRGYFVELCEQCVCWFSYTCVFLLEDR